MRILSKKLNLKENCSVIGYWRRGYIYIYIYVCIYIYIYIYIYGPSNYNPLKGERFTQLQISAFRYVRLFKVNFQNLYCSAAKTASFNNDDQNFRIP